MPATIQLDLVRQCVWFIPPGSKDTIVLETNNVESISSKENQTFVLQNLPMPDLPAGTPVICRQWYNGKNQLVQQLVKRLVKGTAPTAYAPGTPDEYVSIYPFWVRKPDGTWSKISLKKKEALSLLKNKEKAVSAFIEREKLDLTKPESWAVLLREYDKL